MDCPPVSWLDASLSCLRFIELGIMNILLIEKVMLRYAGAGLAGWQAG